MELTIGLSLAFAACGEDSGIQPLAGGDPGGYGRLDHGALTVDESIASAHIPCLDANGDDAVTLEDAAAMDEMPDFNADGTLDEFDAAFFDVGLELDPARDKNVCGSSEQVIDYFVTARMDTPVIACDEDAGRALLVVAIGGAIPNLERPDDAAGVRWMANHLLDKLEDDDVPALTIVTGPAFVGGAGPIHGSMEVWLTHSIRRLLEQYSCMNAAIFGHSHGAVSGDAVAARVEETHAGRIVASVSLDRIEDLYFGDTSSRPRNAPILNAYETNDEVAHGDPYEASNVENWDASGEDAPKDGESGGEPAPITHSTIDNSDAVRDRLIDFIMTRLER